MNHNCENRHHRQSRCRKNVVIDAALTTTGNGIIIVVVVIVVVNNGIFYHILLHYLIYECRVRRMRQVGNLARRIIIISRLRVIQVCGASMDNADMIRERRVELMWKKETTEVTGRPSKSRVC